MTDDPRIAAVPDIHGHAKGEHKLYVDERPIPYTARMLFLWFFHACRRGAPRFLMVADHINYLTFEDPAAVNLVRRALKLAQAGDLYGAAETAGVEVAHASVVGEGLRRGMRYSIGAEVDNDPRSRPDAQNIVDAMRPDGIVRSVHFLPITHPQFGENWMWPFDNPEFRDLYDVVGTEQTWEIYMATLLEAIEKLPGHIVGHFYVPGKFGHWPADDVLESYEDRLLAACAERGMAVEINARTFYKNADNDEAQLEKYRAVNLRLLRKAKERGVAIAVGSDAHSPKDQGRGFTEILALLDEAEVNEISFPIDGRMARVALRATDELRQASARNGISKDQTEVAIPGTEQPDPDEEAAVEPAHADAVANEGVAAAVLGPTPRKRPSRAKKPAVPTEEREPAALSATAPEVVAATESSHAQPPSSVPKETAPEDVPLLDAAPSEPVGATEAAAPEPAFVEDMSANAAAVPAHALESSEPPDNVLSDEESAKDELSDVEPTKEAVLGVEAAKEALLSVEPAKEALRGVEPAEAELPNAEFAREKPHEIEASEHELSKQHAERKLAEDKAAELEPSEDEPSRDEHVAGESPRTAAAADAETGSVSPEGDSNPAGSSEGPAESEAVPEVSAPAKALAAVAAVASAAVAAVVSIAKRSSVEPTAPEPVEVGEQPKRARAAKPRAASKPPLAPPATTTKLAASSGVAAPKSAAASKPAAVKATAAPKPITASKRATAPKRETASKPVAMPKPIPVKNSAKVTKSPARGAAAGKPAAAAAGKQAAASKPASAAAKKRVAVKPAPKKAAASRAAAVAKKSSAKKAAAVRKPVSKVVSKTASRASVKKSSAKKSVKKKKQRR